MSLQPNSPSHSVSGHFPPVIKQSHFWNRLRQQFSMLYHYLLGHYRLPKMLYGFALSQALYVTAKLGVADHLSQGSKTCEELAANLSVNVNGLCHLMRLLSKTGIVSVDKKGAYKLTALGSRLRSDMPNSLRGTRTQHRIVPLACNLAQGYRSWQATPLCDQAPGGVVVPERPTCLQKKNPLKNRGLQAEGNATFPSTEFACPHSQNGQTRKTLSPHNGFTCPTHPKLDPP
ncbi:hypothetical protein BGS_0285 [Beggiatoa sp. SS]|nr:hypothetical protein BGS_0285 [Beggiatoa sp. SS]